MAANAPGSMETIRVLLENLQEGLKDRDPLGSLPGTNAALRRESTLERISEVVDDYEASRPNVLPKVSKETD